MPSLYVCHCECHGENGEQIAQHIVACCNPCQYCGERIVVHCMDAHLEECPLAPRPEPIAA